MKNIKLNIILYFLMGFLFLPLCFAGQTIKVALGESLPPWVIEDKDKGLIIDLLKNALGKEGYDFEFIYLPYDRRILAYANDLADVVCDINPEIKNEYELEGYLSDMSYSYNNEFISLKKNNYKIDKLSQLAEYSILAYEGAKDTLGQDYGNMVYSNKQYRETVDQEVQVKKLFMNRVQVIFMDQQIFNYYRNECSKLPSIDTKQPIDTFVYGRNKMGFLFREKKLCDIYNRNYKNIKNKEKYGLEN